MKANIHPKRFKTQVICACGNQFVVDGSVPELRVEVCSNCHPFYTGQMKYLDTAGRVDAFKARIAQAKTSYISKSEKRKLKKEKQLEKEMERPDTLSELRKAVKKS